MTITVSAPEPSNPLSIALLAKFDGGPSTNQPVDLSLYNRTPVLIGNAIIGTTGRWFGLSAVNCNTAGGVQIPLNSTNFSASNFAIEWFMFNNVSHSSDTILHLGASPDRCFRLRWDGLGNGQLGISLDGINYSNTTFTMNNSASSRWWYFHLQRYLNKWTLWFANDIGTGATATPDAPTPSVASRIVNEFNPGDMYVGGTSDLLFSTETGFVDVARLYLDNMRVTIDEVYYSDVPATIPIPAATLGDFPYQTPSLPPPPESDTRGRRYATHIVS